ncbi:4788_t:CDS:2 [Entrophospora sp. SA101]|nr:4788_t:CDS:2 [Entrophospora sp. SA101]
MSVHSSANSSSREHKQGRQSRDYSKEQMAAVDRIKACDVSDYYAILEITKDVSDAEVKKAYRKLSLQTHPDKNGAPGADEAFKKVSKAFQVLSDPQKRTFYDEHGADPDARNNGVRSEFNGARFSNGFTNGAFFAEDVSPEEIFNMFFNGGGDGFHSATFVGPGFRTRHFHSRRASAQNRHNQQQPMNSTTVTFFQLLPLLILFVYSFYSTIFLSPMQESLPQYSLQATNYHTQSRFTHSLHVPYFVDPNQFSKFEHNPRKLRLFEDGVEINFLKQLSTRCNNEAIHKQQKINDARGWFSSDKEKLEAATNLRTPNCEKLIEISKTKTQRFNEVKRLIKN